MPTDIKLDTTTWDYDLTTNGLQLVEDNPTIVAQRLRIALQLLQGELFTNTIEGIPLKEFSNSRDGGTFADAFMIDYIGSVEGVQEIINYTSNLNTRTRVYEPTVEVRVDTGEIITIGGGS